MRHLIVILIVMFSFSVSAGTLIRSELDPIPLATEGFKSFNMEAKAFFPGFEKSSLTDRSKFALYELANHEVITNTYIVNTNGKLTYLGSQLAASGKKILFQQDYTSYKNVTVDGKTKKVGILLRLEAELITKKANLELNGIFSIGAAASAGSASGRLRLKVYGLSGKEISNAIPAPSDISEQSLMTAFSSIATIKSKIYEEDVYVLPQEIPSLEF